MKRAPREWLACAVLFGLGAPGRLAAQSAASPPPTVLPAILVEGAAEKGPAWQYGACPGFVVLSQCDAASTKSYLSDLFRQSAEIRQWVPARFLRETSLPTTLILYPRWREKALAAEMARAIENAAKRFPGSRLRPIPNLRLDEPDSTMMCAVVDDGPHAGAYAAWHAGAEGFTTTAASIYQPFAIDRIVLSEGYVQNLIATRTPTLPAWLATGVAALYRLNHFERTRLVFDPEPWQAPGQDGVHLRWEEVFLSGLPHQADEAYTRQWSAQAELFVRWALAGDPPRQVALWKFVTSCESAPVSEATFAGAFGMDYAALGQAVAAFLPDAHRKTLELPKDPAPAPPSFALRSATRAETRRIIGEWTRRCAAYLGSRSPALQPLYLEHARQLLQSDYDDGDRDSQLLSSLGLLELGRGHLVTARVRLEAVLTARAPQPCALSHLARLRLDAAVSQPDGSAARLTEAQAQMVLEPVLAARRFQPPQLEAYSVVAALCAHLAQPPTAQELQLLNEGAWLFAQHTALVKAAVVWDRQTGDHVQGRRLAELGLWYLQ